MTTKSTITVSGGAMPKFNRKAIMARAWAIFRETYKYPAIKFSSIGWKCFGWALKQAWAEAREVARLAAMPTVDKAARIAVLNRTIELASYSESWPDVSRTVNAARAEIALLSNQL
ncbi:hypothetical protein NB311A_07308 [Nitrobacter sp. Nb-311A]|uniref:hypothetical protein n=1 Tax=Nitrobacter sp. Nb-311A TaxID=314253 RepID=UPI0000684BFF|nr:hypothetical protein [Nitrobacter sp. Nb-311A]EAQ36938.1 hypothetical protein NB311A_07308 [Nitrobacter sp. Nb-311A]